MIPKLTIPDGAWLPQLLIAASLVPSVAVFLLGERHVKLGVALTVGGGLANVVLAGVLAFGVVQGGQYEWSAALLPGVDLVLRASTLSVLFVLLSAGLWLLTTIYAVRYLEDSPNRARFGGFFNLCIAATTGVALSGNLLTFLIFYELLTIATYPLVAHKGDTEALAAARMYMGYTVTGGTLLLLGTGWMYVLTGELGFQEGGVLGQVPEGQGPALTAIFALLVGGLAVKGVLVPVHGWLPRVMVAPTPVSALLHAVAVVKAGVYGIARVVYDLFGVQVAADLGALTPVAAAAGLTIVYGSIQALRQDSLKRLLAYSTVSQVSYITLGIATPTLMGATGGLAHLVHQGVMKVTLFYCAGNIAKTHGITAIRDLDGIGRRMPFTMGAFTVAALGMIGVPPTAGFISKWHLGIGGLHAGDTWVVAVLVASTVLNAAYFLPVLHRAWLRPPSDAVQREGREADAALLVPALVTGALTLALGAFAMAWWSALPWARTIAVEVFP